MDVRTGAREAGEAAADARESPALEWGARVGFAVYGLVYGVLAWLTVQVAFGAGRSAKVSQDGALAEMARQPLGGVVLWVAFAGFCALVLWEVATAIAGHHRDEGRKKVVRRLGAVFKAVVFAAFAVTTAQVAIGGRQQSGHDSTRTWTARVLGWPAGPAIIVVVGLVIVGYGIFSIVKGVTDRWRNELDSPDASGSRREVGTAIGVLARVGYASRGVAFGVIGALVVWAAFTEDPKESAGLDQALQRLRHAPLGSVLLVVIAIGFACYGLYNLARAWHLRRR